MLIELDRKCNAAQVLEAMKMAGSKGANIYVQWRRDMKTRKGTEATVEKVVTAPVRYGVDYANMSAVKSGIAAGTRGEVESLPWGQWREGYEGLVIDHKGQEYVRFAAGTFANMKRSSSYLLNGKPATQADIEPLCLASEFRDNDETPTVFNVKPGTITAIGVAE